MDNSKHLYWLLGAVGINRLCSLVPAYVYFDPFPFYEVVDENGVETGITLQSYIFGISVHAIVMALFFLLCKLTSAKYYQLFHMLFLLEIASLIDYFLIFEHPFIYTNWYNFEFSDIKLACYTLIIFKWMR